MDLVGAPLFRGGAAYDDSKLPFPKSEPQILLSTLSVSPPVSLMPRLRNSSYCWLLHSEG